MTEQEFHDNYEVVPYSGCWIWKGVIVSGGGYGLAWYRGKHQRAHRIIYELIKGEIPDGMYVCHTCDTRCCVNPEHLFLGTQKDNIHDAVSKGKMGKNLRGEKNGRSKLTPKYVKHIRQLIEQHVEQEKIASLYNVVPHTISDIKRGKSWRWLE